MEYLGFLPILYVTAGSAGIACVLYAIQENLRPVINRLLLALGISCLLWSFGLALQTLGADAFIRYVGSRAAPLGYASLFALLLHYTLLLVRGDRPRLSRFVLLLVYLPGAITVFGLSVYPILFRVPDEMLRTRFGWVNITSNGWINFFYCYYLVYAVLILTLLWRWNRHTANARQRKQASALIHSLLACLLLGSVTDLLLVLWKIRIPSVASVFSVLPLCAVSYSACCYGFMRNRHAEAYERILDKNVQYRINRIAAWIFISASALNFLGQRVFYHEIRLTPAPLFSLALLLIGVSVWLLFRLELNDGLWELIMAVTLAFTIPMVLFRFAIFGAITVWASCFLLLLVTLLFNRHILIITVLLSSAQTLLLLWCVTPRLTVQLDKADYIVRIGLILLSSLLAYYVNGMYRGRLNENARHAARQQVLSEISRSLVSADEETLEECMTALLNRCGVAAGCKRGLLLLWRARADGSNLSIEWSAEGERGETLAPRGPSAYEALLRGGAVGRDSCGEGSVPEAGSGALIFLPVAKAGRRLGFLSFTRNESLPGRDETPTLLLSIAANAIADTLVRLEDNRKIEWTAYHDGLTGLPNRLLFGKRLDQAIAKAEEAGGALGVAYVDLDSFKSINDTIGHQAGNQLIIDAASQLSGCTREGDCAARFGGDEFVLLLHVSGVDELTEKVQAVLSAVQKPIALCGQDYFITCSIGVALYPRDGTDARALLKNADLAMYQAKSQGKNQFALCSQLLKDRVRDSTRLTNLLFRALERSQLLVYYQPQVSLQSRQIVGLEALLRWRLPEEGFVGPQVFIPLAEQTGLIYSIGAWVLETACRDCRRWQDMGFPTLRVAVNISVQQIENKQFSALVAETLERTGLASGHLELEVTESVANSRAVNMVERMNQLKALGVSLSIDDFGTGYSSLERLKLMPIDRIKMDIQFVQGIEKSEKDRAIAQVIIDLAKSLDMKVIAEGVETEEQLDFLMQRACDEVQGYYYYKPLPAPELEELLRIQPPLNHNAALAGQN